MIKIKNGKVHQLVKILTIICITAVSVIGVISVATTWTNKELDKCFSTLFDITDYHA